MRAWRKLPPGIVPRGTSAPAAPAKPKSKYGSVRTEVEGINFDSKMEATYYGHLLLRKAAGEILTIHRQVKVDLGGGMTHRIDFMLVLPDGVEYHEVKGYDTPEGKRIRLIAESRLPQFIRVIDRKALKALTRA